jgi:hypothetical protein
MPISIRFESPRLLDGIATERATETFVANVSAHNGHRTTEFDGHTVLQIVNTDEMKFLADFWQALYAEITRATHHH